MIAKGKDRQKLQELEAFLSKLPEKELRKLAAAIELDRHENKFGLPHDALMALIRPSLARIRAPRVYSPQRLLCLPFEDMLVPGDPDPKEVGRVSRKSIAPMWDWLTKKLLADDWPALADAVVKAQRKGDDAGMDAASRALWAGAHAALEAGLEPVRGDVGEMRQLAKRLGGTPRLEDIKEMSAVLGLAEEAREVKRILPDKPVLDLGGRAVNAIKRLYLDVAEEKAGFELFFVLVVMARLLQPYPILKVFAAISERMDDLIASRRDLALAADKVFEALDEDVAAVETLCADDASDDAKVMGRTQRFAAAFKLIVAEIGIKRDGQWGKRMFAFRGRVSKALEAKLLADAPHAVLSVFPTQTTKDRKITTAKPDFSKSPDEDRYAVAETRALAIAEAMAIADQIGLSASAQATVKTLREELNKYATRILEMLPKVPAPQKETATAHLYTAVRLIEVLTTSEEADLLRRRGNAALKGQAVPG